MSANRSIPRSVPFTGAQSLPQESLGAIGTSNSGPLFSQAPVRESREEAAQLDAQARAAIADAAMQDGVDVGWSKRSDFGDDLGQDTSQVSLALNRKPDKRLKVQTWDSTYVVQLMERPAALFRFIQRLGTPFGIQSIMVDPTDEGHIRRELARELPEKRKRQFEREHGLPEGWLER